VKTAGALVLLALLLWSLRRTGLRPGLRELRDNAREAWGWLRGLRLRPILASRVTQGLLALWLLSLLASGFVRVPPGAVALQQRFGKLVGEPRPPGAVLALPGIDRVALVQVDAVREQPVGYRTAGRALGRTPVTEESMFLTGDENVIDLHAEAQYRVSDPVAFRLGVEKPDALLAGVMRARLVEAMAGAAIDRVYTDERSEIEGHLLAAVRSDVAKLGLGIEVLGMRLLDVHAPATVHDAFRDVASAHEDRLTTIHRANEYKVGEVALARGNAERALAGAQAQASGRVAAAKGAASAFEALAAEHRRAPGPLEDRLYLETAERALVGARKIVRPGGSAGRATELWLRAGDAPIAFPPSPPAAGPAPARTP
jgi:membrane protease subunit HflK